jgi:1-deoxy-D-xylulose-5-phosphate reductoisomerase
MRRRLVILGSTGSIGKSALDVVASRPDEFDVVGLSAGTRAQTLLEQAREFNVDCIALADEQHREPLTTQAPPGTHVFTGSAGLIELVEASQADLVLTAIVGAAGLPSTLRTVELGIDVALANKESLVVAGDIIIPLAAETGSRLIPVDSEHSAIFQSLQSGRAEEVRRILLTASGGPFRTWTTEQIQQATLADALQHPTWTMGPKITIDSATMMNKALEIIEAHYLFGIPANRIDVLVHPESIVHSMVEFIDGSTVAQLGTPDMRTPIQYALTYPERVDGIADHIDWTQISRLNFELPDETRFPALRLGRQAAAQGGTAGAVFNAANEAAVARFQREALRFVEIAQVVEEVMDRHAPTLHPSLDELLAADAWARDEVAACLAT